MGNQLLNFFIDKAVIQPEAEVSAFGMFPVKAFRTASHT